MSTIYAKIKANWSQIYDYLKWLSIPIVIFALYYQLFVMVDYKEALITFTNNISFKKFGYLLIAILFMPINLGFEAAKWKLLVQKLVPISFRTSLNSIFAGISLSIFTPKRIGEYGGRLLILPNSRKKAITALFVGNLSQTIANLIIGLISITIFLFNFNIEMNRIELIIAFAAFIILLLLLAFFNMSRLTKVLNRYQLFKEHLKSSEVVGLYQSNALFQLLALSTIKYTIFIIQFVLIVKAFGIDISIFWGTICASCVFFIKTMLPIPASVELAARGNIAIYFFSFFTENHIGILVASIILWVINLAVPALYGSLLISKSKMN